MKLSKLFKIALPILGIATIATIVPLALTSCSNQSNSSANPNNPSQGQQQVQVLEPVDINSLPVPAHNFKNSFTQQPTTITSLADANKQLQEQWASMNETQKAEALKNDLQNWANTYNQYVYNQLPKWNPSDSHSFYPSMLSFQPMDESANQLFSRFILQNDPRGQESMPNTYKYRIFNNFAISNISFKNSKLSFTFTNNQIYQISDGTNVIAQINDCIESNYSNYEINTLLVPFRNWNSNNPTTNYYSSFVLINGTTKCTEQIKDIISNNTTPFTNYFKEHVNSTITTSNDSYSQYFQLKKPVTINSNFDNFYSQCEKCHSGYTMYSPGTSSAESLFSLDYEFYYFGLGQFKTKSQCVLNGFTSPTLNVLDTLNTTSSGSPATTQNK